MEIWQQNFSPKITDQVIWQPDDDDAGEDHQAGGKAGDATSGQEPRLLSHVVRPGAGEVKDQAHPEYLDSIEKFLFVIKNSL